MNKKDRYKSYGKNIMSASATQGGHDQKGGSQCQRNDYVAMCAKK